MGQIVSFFFQSHLSWDNNMFVSGPSVLACVVLHLCADTHLLAALSTHQTLVPDSHWEMDWRAGEASIKVYAQLRWACP
jgi:hypothetical protein